MAQATLESQHEALARVLGSRTFDRSEQLKAILRYVCERTWEGSAGEISEYGIGVNVLGRGKDFSPQEDSIVRNRAFALRKKLDEFYAEEGAEQRIRIGLPKGSYTPVFSETTHAEPDPVPMPLPTAPAAAGDAPAASRRHWLVLAAGLGLGAGLEYAWLSGRLRPRPSPAMRTFWGAMLNGGEKVALCVGTPAQSFLRTLPEEPRVAGTYPVDARVAEWFGRQRVDRHGPVLTQVPTMNSPLWGDAAGSARVAAMLAEQGVSSEVLAERLIALPALRNRNVVFLGTSEYSPSVTRLLADLPFGIAYDTQAGDHIGLRYDAAGMVVERFPVGRLEDGKLSEVFGLVTRLPGEGDGQESTQYVVLSGVSSAGILAAAEYVTSSRHLEELSRRVPLDSQPLQVLVKARADKTLPLSFAYAAHAVGRRAR